MQRAARHRSAAVRVVRSSERESLAGMLLFSWSHNATYHEAIFAASRVYTRIISYHFISIVAQPTTFHLKPLHIDDANCDACDDPGGDIDDPGGGSTNNEGSFNRFTTSASTFSKTPASYFFRGVKGGDLPVGKKKNLRKTVGYYEGEGGPNPPEPVYNLHLSS